MPQTIALELCKAYQAKRQSDPSLPRETLFKHLLWASLDGCIIRDAELDRMARDAQSLYELAVMVVMAKKPQFKDPHLADALRRDLKTYFSLNMPDGLSKIP